MFSDFNFYELLTTLIYPAYSFTLTHYPNSVCRKVQITKLLNKQLSLSFLIVLSEVQTFSSVPFFSKSLIHILPLRWKINFHINATHQQVELKFVCNF
jgi:hypothetical protein